jgi:hypothetical protein
MDYGLDTPARSGKRGWGLHGSTTSASGVACDWQGLRQDVELSPGPGLTLTGAYEPADFDFRGQLPRQVDVQLRRLSAAAQPGPRGPLVPFYITRIDYREHEENRM